MKAAYYERDERIRVGEVESVEVGPGQIEIDVAYCGICGTDVGIYRGKMDWRVAPSQIMGHEMSGVVRSVGRGVSVFAAGDNVTVMPLDPCGRCPTCRAGLDHICENLKFLGIDTPGAFQTRWIVPEHTVRKLPDGLPLSRAALIEPIAVACHDVRLGEVDPGHFVVVLGGGPIGALIALIARLAGARVLVSEVNPFRIDLLEELGLEVVDPGAVDLAEKVRKETDGVGADVVFEVTGHPSVTEVMTRLPRARGLIVAVGIFAKPPEIDLFQFFWKELRLRGARVYERRDFDRAIELAASEALPLDRLLSEIHPLEELKKGLDQMASGGRIMKVLIRCNESMDAG